MKNIFVAAALIAASSNMFALTFWSEAPNREAGSAKMSELTYYSENNNTGVLKGQPGKGDSVVFRDGADFTNIIDKDIAIREITVNSHVLAESRKIAMTGKLCTHLPGEFSTNMFELRKSALVSKSGIETYNVARPDAASFGAMAYKFVDSTATFNGNYMLTFNVPKLGNKEASSGSSIILEGKSKVEFGGVVLIDNMTIDNPEYTHSNFEFVERNGNIPTLIFKGTNNDLGRSSILLRITPMAKAGVYPLILFSGRNAKLRGSFDYVMVNNKKLKLGEKCQVADLTVCVAMQKYKTERDSAVNDIVLTVEKSKK